MTHLIDRSTRVLVMRNTEAAEVHHTVLAAVATQSDTTRALLQQGTCNYRDLLNDVEQLLDDDDLEPAYPRAWRFIQTDCGYLGPAFFATNSKATVAACEDTQVWVTDAGFTFSTAGKEPTGFMAIETDGTETALIFPDGTESAPLKASAKRLACYLADNHPYVTGTQTSYRAGVENFLHKLRARLLNGDGPAVDLI